MTYTYLIPQIPTDKDHIQVGASGLMLKLQIKDGNNEFDLTNASVMNIILERPDSTLITGSASLFASASAGIIWRATSGSSEINQAGQYNMQAYIVTPDFSGYTTPVHFTAYENLPLSDTEAD
jgi:ABC-type uncharacterized transport system permease subunit